MEARSDTNIKMSSLHVDVSFILFDCLAALLCPKWGRSGGKGYIFYQPPPASPFIPPTHPPFSGCEASLVHLYICMLVCLYACMLVCLYACMLECLYACMPVCLYACMPVCLYACKLVCLYACMLALPALHVQPGRRFDSIHFPTYTKLHTEGQAFPY